MKRPVRLRGLAVLLSLCAGALAHAEPLATDGSGVRESTEAGLELRLADGSMLRVPFNAAGRRSAGRLDPANGETPSTDPRRAPSRGRTKVFDPETPGVIASVRG
jgi:hypothetical protein